MAGARQQRSVLSVLFTDIVGSTALAADLGDARWHDLLDAHDSMVRQRLAACGGQEVKSVGDGFVATFVSPTAAIGCAESIVKGAHDLGLQVRAGLHTGEVEMRGQDVGGIGVHVAARVAALAGADEVLVSGTVKDVCDGSGIAFTDWGTHSLRGIPGKRQLFLVGAQRPTRAKRATKKKRAPAKKSAPKTTAAGVRVVVADDHPLWRHTLRGLLETTGGMDVVAEAANGEEAVELVRQHKPDVVLMDIDMPRVNGIEATRRIVADHPTKVLMLSSLKERQEVLAAVRAGACGYLLKTAEAEEVNDAVRRVQAGEIAFPAELTALVLGELRNPQPTESKGGVDGLTERERKVMDLMAGGRSNQAIARELHMAPKTLETHIASIFTKLDLDSTPDHHRRVQAVVTYLRGKGLRDSP